MLPVYMAMPPKGDPVVRGKLLEATYMVFHEGLLRHDYKLHADKAPSQKNNMSAWLLAVVHDIDTKELTTALREHHDEIDYVVNNGRGNLRGRNSYRNVFTYHFGVWKVELIIKTEAHQAIYQRKVKSGEHTPRSREVEVVEPYISSRDGEIKAPMEIYGSTAWQSFSNHEDYYKDNPEMRGKLVRRN